MPLSLVIFKRGCHQSANTLRQHEDRENQLLKQNDDILIRNKPEIKFLVSYFSDDFDIHLVDQAMQQRKHISTYKITRV